MLGTVDVHMYAIVVVLTVVVCLFTSFQGEHTYLKYTLQLKRWDVLQLSNIIQCFSFAILGVSIHICYKYILLPHNIKYSIIFRTVFMYILFYIIILWYTY